MLEGKPLPVGTDYQLGEMYDEYNVRQYVLKRDNYTCQCCGAHTTAKKAVKLHVHHLESRKMGGNAPGNLITLCITCHDALHKGKVSLDNKKRGKPMRDAAFMGIMRRTLMSRLREELPITVQGTYGYITKMQREQNDIKKSHVNDARCISKHPLAEPCSVCYRTKAIRHHNRQTHKANFSKGGIRKRSQMPYVVEGYRLWDKVLYKDRVTSEAMNVIADNTELAENFAETVKHEIETDDDTYAHIGFHLANNIRNQSPASEVLLTLCGWTIETLLDKTPPIAIED